MSGADNVQSAIDRASEADRLYFEAHPGCNRYLRPRQPGEFGPDDDEAPPWVEVTQLAPGVRVRKAIFAEGFS